MKIAVIGCGFVADLYARTLAHYQELELAGAYDRNAANLDSFCRRWPAKPYASLQQAADDPSTELVLNLTNPRSHFEVTKLLIEAGKHVYSEKPLAMTSKDAKELVALADRKRLYLGSAPCSVLAETAQTIWKALKERVIGRPRLVYADFDDGLIAPKLSPWQWRNGRGVPWPAKDEFEVGCTYEHAGYMLTWLAAFFGPAKTVTAYASCQIPDKGIAVDTMAPDFTVGCIEYAEGVVARVTCGLVAPKSKSLAIVGDDGVLSTNNLRNDVAPVYVRKIPSGRIQGAIERRLNRVASWLEARLPSVPWTETEWHFRRKVPLAKISNGRIGKPAGPIDFCRGPAEMVEAIRERRPCRLSARLGLHMTEIIETLQYPERYAGKRVIESAFDPIEPLPWRS
jgi:predicted dehydrogenase